MAYNISQADAAKARSLPYLPLTRNAKGVEYVVDYAKEVCLRPSGSQP
jgi:hypothetical protein